MYDSEKILNCGYDGQWFLYWEARMGNWYSNITQETDFFMETYNFFNYRFILKQLVDLSREDKKAKLYLQN